MDRLTGRARCFSPKCSKIGVVFIKSGHGFRIFHAQNCNRTPLQQILHPPLPSTICYASGCSSWRLSYQWGSEQGMDNAPYCSWGQAGLVTGLTVSKVGMWAGLGMRWQGGLGTGLGIREVRISSSELSEDDSEESISGCVLNLRHCQTSLALFNWSLCRD